jgi:CDP-4-dehydro-6-deoxyglucose reductase
MTYQVYIKPGAYTLTVNEGETIVAALQRLGYRFDNVCKDGLCGACKGQLLDGKVDYTSSSIVGLSEQERELGFALFCQALPQSDLIIHLEGITASSEIPQQTLSCRVVSYQPLAPSVWQVILQTQGVKPLYKAGQYLEILHKDGSPKPFSIANAPNEQGLLELHIRHTAGNPYTAELMAEIMANQVMRVQLPYGSCTYPKDNRLAPTIFLAGGTGFAPFKAILEQAVVQGFTQDTYLYWGARSLKELYLHKLPQNWMCLQPRFRYVPVLSGALRLEDWPGRYGLVHEAVVIDHPDLSNFRVYASGPTEMVYAALRLFQAHGLMKAHMYSDIFAYEAPV